MALNYPLQFSLEDETQVQVSHLHGDDFQFTITPQEGPEHTFNFTDDARPKDVKTATLTLDQLNAVRIFWLKQEEA